MPITISALKGVSMLDTQTIIDGAFLEVCPVPEAVQWLRQTRERAGDVPLLLRDNNKHQEHILLLRGEPYIEFGLARYGTNEEIAREIYTKGTLGIRCTLLAHFPNGGFARYSDDFTLGELPANTEELCALVSNPSLNDGLFEKCFSKKGVFEPLTEEQFQSVLIATSKNPRLNTPYDDTTLDGYAEYSHNNVFKMAWQLSDTLPNTPQWARVLYHLLHRCLPPHGFNPNPAIKRWYFTDDRPDDKDAGFYLRSRLADALAADKALLSAGDPALRTSFYRRFRPADFPTWWKFTESDQEYFLDAALDNSNLWQTEEDRSVLRDLAWRHPDPHSDLLMVNQYRWVEDKMRAQHPNWFSE